MGAKNISFHGFLNDELFSADLELQYYQNRICIGSAGAGFNPFMPNGISLPYQLDQSISDLSVVVWYFFSLFQILIKHSVSR